MPRTSRPEPTLADLGETALIERIKRRAGHAKDRAWAVAIGDDAAILRPRAGDELVFSVDAQVEGVHFRFGRQSARSIGRRALIVNLSDLAAMGAAPVGALLSFAGPASMPVRDFDGIITGVVEEAERFDCPLVGGNLSRASSCSLHVTVIGRCRRGRALRRGRLKAGDPLFVTGVLGAATLARLRADRSGGLLRYVPTPRIAAGQALARMGARACIDLSDGLATDLAHLLEGSGLGAEIEADRLPTPAGFARACAALGEDPLRLAAAGGEDYELLFALGGAEVKSLQSDPERLVAELSARLGVAVSPIGRVVARPGITGVPRVRRGHHF